MIKPAPPPTIQVGTQTHYLQPDGSYAKRKPDAIRIAENRAAMAKGPKAVARKSRITEDGATVKESLTVQNPTTRKSRKVAALPEPSESKMQQSCVRWFYANPKCNHWLLAGIPNGGYALAGTPGQRAAKSAVLKAEGMVKGFSDLMLDTGKNVYYLEAKTSKGKQSESQRAFQLRVDTLGRNYYIFRSLDEFQGIVEQILKG